MSTRIVLAKVGLDGHDRGLKVVARGLRDAGLQVIYGGIWQSPSAIAQAVADEAAQWLGISLLNGAHLTQVPRVIDELRRAGCGEVGIVLGGIIPESDVPQLREWGVAGVFGPGTAISDIASFLKSEARDRRGGQALEPDASADTLVERVQRRDRRALSRLLTWLADGQETAAIRAALDQRQGRPSTGAAVGQRRSIAITGSTGVGKSSLIAKLLQQLRRDGLSVAVLACDPQSPRTGGALLGDRIRMAGLLPDPNIFIRSLAVPSGSQGITANLDLMVRALAWFGFDVTLIETAGAGQGDVAVCDIADTVAVLLQPDTGDGVQWEKAGLLEFADMLVIHKSDLPGAGRLESELREHAQLSGHRAMPMLRASAARNEGLEELWAAMKDEGRRLG